MGGLHSSDDGVSLADLPVEILEKILGFVAKLKHVAQARSVCWKLNVAALNILRASYRQLPVTLKRDIDFLNARFKDNLGRFESAPPLGFPVRYKGKKRMKNLAKSILQLETVLSSFLLVKATTWSQARDATCSHYNGAMVDAILRIRHKIMAAVKREPGTTPAHARSYKQCVRACAREINAFHERATHAARTPADDVLERVSVLQALLCCRDAVASAPLLTSTDTDLVRLSIQFVIRNCWLRIQPTPSYTQRPAEERVREVLAILPQLVWNSNLEHHLADYQQRLYRVATEYESVFCKPHVHMLARNGVFLRHGAQPAWQKVPDQLYWNAYCVVDAMGDRVLYYGTRSRVECDSPTFATIMPVAEGGDVGAGGRVFDAPWPVRDGVLEIRYELVCDCRFLPEELLRRAVSVSEAKFGAGVPVFALGLSSYDDELRGGERSSEFRCYGAGVANGCLGYAGGARVGRKKKRRDESGSAEYRAKRAKRLKRMAT